MRPALCVLLIGACGDNLEPPLDGRPLEPAASLFVIAHWDDDMIFMQPELIDAIASGSMTTVYVTSGDPVYGLARTYRNFEFSRIAYAGVTHDSNWDCGYVLLNGAPLHHCRQSERGISLIAMDIPDGGVDGDYDVGPLHLVGHQVSSVPILGPIHGIATVDSVIDSLAAIITETEPVDIQTLDLAATHGRDHPSHLFSSSFALWAAARVGYEGAIRWHRGYNVGDSGEPPTLDDASYQRAKSMVGYYDACYFGCGPCGTSCTTLHLSHDILLQRQYSYTRSPQDEVGSLAFENDPALCLSASAGRVVLEDCASAPPVHLAATGHLSIAGSCVASAPGASDPVTLEPCSNRPEQYWVSDSEGHLWNGSLPEPSTVMVFDHGDAGARVVRCLNADPQPGAAVVAATCGKGLEPKWRFNG